MSPSPTLAANVLPPTSFATAPGPLFRSDWPGLLPAHPFWSALSALKGVDGAPPPAAFWPLLGQFYNSSHRNGSFQGNALDSLLVNRLQGSYSSSRRRTSSIVYLTHIRKNRITQLDFVVDEVVFASRPRHPRSDAKATLSFHSFECEPLKLTNCS